ncbi:cytosolic iron-sulfur assembly component 2B [Oncorhynchus kisutch]|uniref:Cytosolic iron-sulfur assembly component 2B n=2 Tax=Oncorhynchus TaxID=8016 RepID=A0A8C7FAT7_ONCKI|nr:cytosolic iron-sulfur assembly component 2B [Oncorhynchus kisutch]
MEIQHDTKSLGCACVHFDVYSFRKWIVQPVVQSKKTIEQTNIRISLISTSQMSGGARLENANPLIFQRTGERLQTANDEDEDVADPIDDREIFDLIRSINDPEHPLSLEELNVVEQVRVRVDDQENTVGVEFTPTIPHCSMATLIGLSIKVKLLRSLPERFKIDVHITPGTHASEDAVNKQLADKERVAAALENSQLLEVVNQCLISNARTG